MSELLAKVEMMAQFVELYEDEVHVQMPLSVMKVMKLKDIFDIEFKSANFFMSGKLTIKYREKGVPQSVYYPFNFMYNAGMETFVAMVEQRRAMPPEEKEPRVIIKEVIKVRCRYCEGLMDEKAPVCPVCGRPGM
jgi:hypothetical protein